MSASSASRLAVAIDVAPPGWYAVRTRSNHEGVAVGALSAKGIHSWLPAVAVPSLRRGGGRRATLRRPLFPSYFFVRADLSRGARIEVLQAPGVVGILGSAGAPVAVPEREIHSIRTALDVRNPFEILYNLVAGARVRIATGPLAGVEGVLMQGPDGHSRIAISIELLGRTVVFKLNARDVSPI